MNVVRTHKDLMVWKKSVSLASRIYSLTQSIPQGLAAHDQHSLSVQMRRSALSVASSIAEGAARGGRTEYIRFLGIARGSLSELETQIHIALELQIIDRASQIDEQVAEVSVLLGALHRRLREHRERAHAFEPARGSTPTH